MGRGRSIVRGAVPGPMIARRGISRRDFLKLTGAGLAGASLLGVAGCGGGGGGDQGGGGGELVFAMGPDNVNGIPRLVDRFNQEQGGNVTYKAAPTQSDQFFDQLRNQFQAGESSPQIVGGDVIWPAQFAGNGFIAPLTEYFPPDQQGEFTQGSIQSNTYEGDVYGVPWYTDVGLLYYRKDLLEQAGFSEPPKTWEELKQQAQKVQQDAGTKFGMVFQGSQYEGGVCNGLEHMRTHGGDVLAPNDPNKVVIDSPEAAAGLATYRSMVEDGVAPQSVTTFTELESHAPFLSGDSVFIRNWPYMYALIGSKDFPQLKPEQVGVVPLPIAEGGQLAGTLGGWNMLINTNAEDPEAAYKFAEFVNSPEMQKFYAQEAKFVPTRRDLLEDPDVQKAIPYLTEASEAFTTAKPRPVSPVYSDMSLRMQEQFNAVLAGQIPADEATGRLQEDLQGIVEQGQA